MKHYIIMTMAVAALMATGCRHREAPTLDGFQGGVTASEVENTREAEDYDFALMATTTERQLVTYGWRDSLHFFTRVYDGSDDTLHIDHASSQSLADDGVSLEALNDSVWCLRMRGVPKWVLNVRLGWTRVTSDGVEFDVRFWGRPMAHCTFVCDDPALLSTRLLDMPEVRELVLHVVFVQLLTSDKADREDEWDDIMEEMDEAEEERSEGVGMALIDTVFVSHGCSADRAFDRLEQRAKKLGFGSFELHHQEGHKGCYMQCTHGLGGVKKCQRRMEEMSKVAAAEGLAFSIKHNGDPHFACTFRAWKAD